MKGTRHGHSEQRQAEDDATVATDDNDDSGLNRPTPPHGIPRRKAVNATDSNAITWRAATGTAPPKVLHSGRRIPVPRNSDHA